MTTCDPRFNYKAAIEALHKEAIALGARPHKGCDPGNPYAIALPHVLCHDLSDTDDHDVDGKDVDAVRCESSPSKLCGVCFALWELLEFQNEATTQVTHALRDLAVVSRATHDGLLKLSAVFAEQSHGSLEVMRAARYSAVAAGLRGERIGKQLESFRRAVDLQNQAAEALRQLSENACEFITSPELRKPVAAGRSPDLLLNAVYRHLKWGGYKPAEAGALVPDGLGGECNGRVANRFKAPDARSVVPAEFVSSE